ncbi:MAG TPA: DUF4238 domain-containing protein [Rhodocyclaceae bacterium]|jgi:hypothetical protein
MTTDDEPPWVHDDWSDLLKMPPGVAEELANLDPVLTGPKRHHFVPRFYLKGFCRDGLLAVYDREKNEIRNQKPDDTTVIGHFYTAIDEQGRKRFELEKALSTIESSASPVIQKLVNKEEISDTERMDLALFVGLGMCRTPDHIDSIKSLNEQMVKQMNRFAFGSKEQAKQVVKNCSDPPSTEEELEEAAAALFDLVENDEYEVETHPQWALGMALQMFSVIVPIIVQRHWRVLHRDNEKRSFITSDAPVVLTTVAPRPPGFMHRGIGFANQDALVVFPLSESAMLLIYGEGGDTKHMTGSANDIRHFNLMIAERCQRFLMGRDATLVRSLTDHLKLANKKWQPKMGTH